MKQKIYVCYSKSCDSTPYEGSHEEFVLCICTTKELAVSAIMKDIEDTKAHLIERAEELHDKDEAERLRNLSYDADLLAMEMQIDTTNLEYEPWDTMECWYQIEEFDLLENLEDLVPYAHSTSAKTDE